MGAVIYGNRGFLERQPGRFGGRFINNIFLSFGSYDLGLSQSFLPPFGNVLPNFKAKPRTHRRDTAQNLNFLPAREKKPPFNGWVQ